MLGAEIIQENRKPKAEVAVLSFMSPDLGLQIGVVSDLTV